MVARCTSLDWVRNAIWIETVKDADLLNPVEEVAMLKETAIRCRVLQGARLQASLVARQGFLRD